MAVGFRARGMRLAIALLAVLGSASPSSAQTASDLSALLTPSPSRLPFALEAGRADNGDLLLRWRVEPGNYLYRDSLEATLEGRSVTLERPDGEAKDDPNFGPVQVFHEDVEARAAGLGRTGDVKVTFQGCSDAGICFPPQARLVDLGTLKVRESRFAPMESAAGSTSKAPPARLSADPSTNAVAPIGSAASGDIGSLLRAGPGWTMLAFLGFGLMLAATPCVFPMIPILAGMLTGAGLTRRRSLVLTGSYVLAMAGAYGLVGAVAGWSGANLQAALQTPPALGITAAIFVALALSMFGLFDLALPAGLTARLAGRSGSGSIGGAALLGFGSALIVGPCVTPPLAGAMLYAASTGDAATGAGALFMLGLGMGLPLMLVGLFGPALLPRSGVWLVRARQMFGAVFLAVAVLLVGRLLPPPAALALLGVLLVGAGVFFGGFDRLTEASGSGARLARGGGMVAALYGAMLIMGAAAGAQDPLRPLAFATAPTAPALPLPEGARVASAAAFDRALARMAAQETGGAPILVDFTAAWCTVCKSNEKVMATPELRARLAAVPKLIADVTDYGEATRTLMERFRVAGPPTLFLIDAEGREIPGSRIVGPVTVEDIARRLDAAGA